MMGWLLGFLPRRWLQEALFEQWRATLPYDEYIRVGYWGASGNPKHHEFSWADKLES